MNNEINLSSFSKGNENIILGEAESYKIVSSNEFQNILRLQNHFLDLIKKAKVKGVSIEKLQKAALKSTVEKNNFKFYEILFGSVSVGRKFIEELQMNRKLLFDKNEVLRNNTSAFLCLSCKKSTTEIINFFFDNYESIDKVRFKLISASTTLSLTDLTVEEAPVCGSYWQQVKLAACAALCSGSTAGAGTVLCGWACWCMLCTQNSALADVIC